MIDTLGYAVRHSKDVLAPFSFQRRTVGPTDVRIEILYCGVCHSDIHQARNEWRGSSYPLVPGHEIIGLVSEVGPQVTKFKVGDMAGVGCLVDSCRSCINCDEGLEQFCACAIQTYNSPDKHIPGQMTYGGYSQRVVVEQDCVLHISPILNPEEAAPLLCAGITTYSPLRHWKVGPGKTVGIVGLGGLGHMGVKFARAFDAHVVLFTTSPHKVADGLRLGAHEVVLSSDKEAMLAQANRFDMILDAVSAPHDPNAYLALLKRDGSLVFVGLPEDKLPVNIMRLVGKRASMAGSNIGGIRETQEMLDFCAENGITCDVEIISMKAINAAYERMLKGDVKYRFVIDMMTLK